MRLSLGWELEEMFKIIYHLPYVGKEMIRQENAQCAVGSIATMNQVTSEVLPHRSLVVGV